MFFQTSLFIFLSIFLFFLGAKLTTQIYHTLLLITQNKKASLTILLIFLLPGTIIHELSHFIVASILFVPVGNISIFPKEEEGTVKAGSVHHADTDILRRTAIGLAPIIVGLILIYLLGNILITNFSFQLDARRYTLDAIFVYLLSIISLSMFSSKKDLETTWYLFPILFIAILSLYATGVRIGLTPNLQNLLETFFSNLNLYLFITVIIDLSLFLILQGLMIILEKVLKRRIVT